MIECVMSAVLNRFGDAVRMDDTDGYFVVGGGKFVRGIEGFYGPVTYYRTRTPSFNPVRLTFAHNMRFVIDRTTRRTISDFPPSPTSSSLVHYGW